jgi:hypothetical protein
VITFRVYLGTVSHHSKQLIDLLQVVPPTPPLVTVSLQAGLAKEVELLLKCVVLVVQEQQAMPIPELLTTILLAGVSETTSQWLVQPPDGSGPYLTAGNAADHERGAAPLARRAAGGGAGCHPAHHAGEGRHGGGAGA